MGKRLRRIVHVTWAGKEVFIQTYEGGVSEIIRLLVGATIHHSANIIYM